MIPDHFYITGLGIIIYLVLYLPAVLVFLWSLWRQIKHLLWPVVVPLGLVLVTLPFWDVYITSLDASRLCKEQGGLHVYKTVEVEGIASYGEEYWLNNGFSYVEHAGVGPGKHSKLYRYTLKNGKVESQEISGLSAIYSIRSGDNHKPLTRSIFRLSQQTFNRITNEVLGEYVRLNIHPGWFDSLTLGWAGMILWHCGSPDGREIGEPDIVKATIKPIREVSQ